jgi:hypothetical protein
MSTVEDGTASSTFDSVGKRSNLSSSGDIAEIILCNSALSDSERAGIEKYLSNKYAISVSEGIDFSTGQTFKNLDTNKMYRIDTSGLKSTADFDLEMEINNDSGANYVRQYLRGTATTPSANNSTINQVLLGGVSSDYPGKSSLLLFPKVTGDYRPMILTSGYEDGSAFFIDLNAYWWTNTADSLHSFKIYASEVTPMSGNIKIWEIAIPEN